MEKPYILVVNNGLESKVFVDELQKLIPKVGVLISVGKHIDLKYDFLFCANIALPGDRETGSPKYCPQIELFRYNLTDIYICENGFGKRVSPGTQYNLFDWVLFFMGEIRSSFSKRTYSWEESIMIVLKKFKKTTIINQKGINLNIRNTNKTN